MHVCFVGFHQLPVMVAAVRCLHDAVALRSCNSCAHKAAQSCVNCGCSAVFVSLCMCMSTTARSEVVTIKLGRRGATPQLATAIQNAWRSTEVVKLRIHDDKVRTLLFLCH